MTDTLHSVARRMAAAGRLPGIALSQFGDSVWSITPRREASEGDLMHAAIQHAMSKKWHVRFIHRHTPFDGSYVEVIGPLLLQAADGTTALSVLLAVEKACDAAEGGGR